MRLISLLLGIFFEQALGFVDQKVYGYYTEFQNRLAKIQNKFLISLALVLIFSSSFSAFIIQLGKNLDEGSGFHWSSSLTLYIVFLGLSLMGLLFFNCLPSQKNRQESKEELNLEDLQSLMQEFAAQSNQSRPRRKKRTKRS